MNIISLSAPFVNSFVLFFFFLLQFWIYDIFLSLCNIFAVSTDAWRQYTTHFQNIIAANTQKCNFHINLM